MNLRVSVIVWLVTSASLAAAAPIHIPEATNASMRAIRVGQTALAFYEAGDWQAALEKFEAADAIMHSPVFRLYMARCLREKGLWLDAVDLYRTVGLAELAPGAPQPWREATHDARRELQVLERQMPVVTLRLRGSHNALEVSVDGQNLSLAPSLTRALDPGTHELIVRRTAVVLEHQSLVLNPGDQREIVLGPYAEPAAPHQSGSGLSQTTEPGLPPSTIPARLDAPQRAVATRPVVVVAPQRATETQPAAVVALGVGALGIAVGAVAGLAAMRDRNTLEAQCSDTVCDPRLAPIAERGKALANLATVALGVGVAGIASGSLMLTLIPAQGSGTSNRFGGWHIGTRWQY